jgi:hypothetical protein
LNQKKKKKKKKKPLQTLTTKQTKKKKKKKKKKFMATAGQRGGREWVGSPAKRNVAFMTGTGRGVKSDPRECSAVLRERFVPVMGETGAIASPRVKNQFCARFHIHVCLVFISCTKKTHTNLQYFF